MTERTVTKRVIKSKCMASMFVWLGFEYVKTEEGFEFQRSPEFDLAWKDVHSLGQYYRRINKK